MFSIKEELSNGCLMIVNEDGNGASFIETGDIAKAQQILSLEDFEKAKKIWTQDKIEKRKNEIKQQEQSTV